jgi:spore coat protein JB
VSSMNNMQNSNRRTQINDLSDLDMGNRIDMNMRRNLQSGMDMRDGTDMRGGMDMNIKAANREACARLLHTIQMYSFVLLETNLYLDSHPNDQMALEYFRKYSQLLKQAREEYESQCGPLSPNSNFIATDTWRWVEGPWPWQPGAN